MILSSNKSDSTRLYLIAIAYFIAHFISFLFPDSQKVLMAVWPPGGVGLAALLLSPIRLWTAIAGVIFLTGNIANIIEQRPLINSLGFMTANVMESLGCAWLMIRICGASIKFDSLREVLALIFSACFINAITACVGAGVAAFTSNISFGHFWRTWWIADGLGILIIAPLVVVWADVRRHKPIFRWTQWIEFVLFLLVWSFAAWRIFNPGTHFLQKIMFPYVLNSLLAWPALRFGQKGVMLSVSLLGVILVSSQSVTFGPLIWGGVSLEDRLLLAQFYLGFTTAIGMLLAASSAENKRGAKILKESEANLSRAQSIAHVGNWSWDIQKDEVFWSKEMYSIFGVKPDSFKPSLEAINRLIHPDDLDLQLKAVDVFSKGSAFLTWEYRVIWPDRSIRVLKVISSDIERDDFGRPIKVFGTVQDVTDSRKLSDELRQLNEELERRVQERTQEVMKQNEKLQELFLELAHMSRVVSLGQLSSALAHEINQPLGTILNKATSAKILLEQSSPDIQKVQDVLSSIIAEDERASEVIRKIRALIKKEPAESEFLDLNAIIRDVEGLLKSRIKINRVSFTLDLQSGLGMVKGNKVQLQQVLVNLVGNALDALRSVKERRICIRTEARGADTVLISVINSGPRIDSDDMETLFKPFFSSKIEGLGVGLFISREIIQAHGGELHFDNDSKEGVVFFFSLPTDKCQRGNK